MYSSELVSLEQFLLITRFLLAVECIEKIIHAKQITFQMNKKN